MKKMIPVLVLASSFSTAESSTPELLSDALQAKLAYYFDIDQLSFEKLNLVLNYRYDPVTYEQYVSKALSLEKNAEVQDLTKTLLSLHPNDSILKNNQLLLAIYFNQKSDLNHLANLSTVEIIGMFEKWPGEARYQLLEKLCRSDYVAFPSVRAFLVEVLIALGYGHDALELLNHPISHINKDLLLTVAHHLDEKSITLFVKTHMNIMLPEAKEHALILLALNSADQIKKNNFKMFEPHQENKELIQALISGKHFQLAEYLLARNHFSSNQKNILYAHLNTEKGDYKKAMNFYNHITNKFHPDALLIKSKLLYQFGDYQKAFDTLKLGISEHELTTDLVKYKLELLVKLDPEHALWVIEEFMEQSNMQIDLFLLQAKAFVDLKRHQEALEILTMIHYLDPDHLDVTLTLAAVLSEHCGRSEEALSLIQQHDSIANNPQLMIVKAQIFNAIGKKDLAITTASEAVNLSPSRDLIEKTAKIMSVSGKKELFEKILTEVEDKYPEELFFDMRKKFLSGF